MKSQDIKQRIKIIEILKIEHDSEKHIISKELYNIKGIQHRLRKFYKD